MSIVFMFDVIAKKVYEADILLGLWFVLVALDSDPSEINAVWQSTKLTLP